MHVLFIIGEKYMYARIALAYFTSDRDSQQYTSFDVARYVSRWLVYRLLQLIIKLTYLATKFDPTRNGFIHYPIAGSYVSQMRDIPSYLILFRDLYRSFESQDVLDMIRLAAYHDFMAFLAV